MDYTYKKKYINDLGGFVYIQCYDNEYSREVPADRPDLVTWLQSNTPEEIAYVAPPLPDLATYKQAKKDAIGNECIARIMAVTGSQNPTTLIFDLIYFNSKATKLINRKALKGEDLTGDETTLLTFLETQENSCNAIREYSDSLKSQVDAAVDHTVVDAIGWE